MAIVRVAAGERFGKLTSVQRASSKDHHTKWRCVCDCGGVVEVRSDVLRRGGTKSCGCLHKKHGLTKTREFKSWVAMRARCYNPTDTGFKNYGGRGIAVCIQWMNSFEQFLNDMGPRPIGMSLGRKKNDEGYFPDNCRWETASQQNYNRRDMPIRKLPSIAIGAIKLCKSGISMREVGRRIGKGSSSVSRWMSRANEVE